MSTPIGALRKTSLVDYPGRVAAVLFLQGCNLRCPYCYNVDLVTGNTDNYEAVSFSDVEALLEKRKNVLSGFVISGGETLISPILPDLIRMAKNKKYAVKLDTNGILTDKLKSIISTPDFAPDYIAMDIKTTPERYNLLTRSDSMAATEGIKKSIKLLSELPQEKVEFRTVLVPGLVTKADIQNIAKLLPTNANWFFSQFRNENCLDPAYNDIAPYLDAELKELVSEAQKIIPKAKLR